MVNVSQREYRPILVNLDAASAVSRIHRESLVQMAEAGELRWVWDLGTGSDRVLRIWLGELLNRQSARLPLVSVLSCVMGPGQDQQIRASAVSDMLSISKPHLHALVHTGMLAGPLIAGVRYITRDSLKNYLVNHLLEPEPQCK